MRVSSASPSYPRTHPAHPPMSSPHTFFPPPLLLQEMGENLMGAIFSFTKQLAEHPERSSEPAQVRVRVPLCRAPRAGIRASTGMAFDGQV